MLFRSFKLRTGMTDLVHIPYKGAGPGIADLISGHIPIMSPNISGQVLEFHKTGKIRIVAVNSLSRLKAAPDIPTAIEQGVPDMVGQLFLGIYAPAATPKSVVETIAAATKKAVDSPEFEKTLTDSGFEPLPYYDADSARRHMATEMARWQPVVDAIGMRAR